jgi:hypothetical protein
MAFKFKDLIIDVLHGGGPGRLCGPATKMDPDAARICGPATIIGGAVAPCGPATKPDPNAARICGPATIEPELARICGPATLFNGLHVEDLTTLKRQLEEALARVREQEAESEPAMPATRAEVEELEKKLQSALDELREHKKGLA